MSLKCGFCSVAFIPTVVDGVDIKNKDKKDGNDSPKTEKLKKAGGSTSRSKLEWVEVDSSVQSCDAEISSSQEGGASSGSPSVLCEGLVSGEDLKCLCVKRDGRVKHVCGACKLSLKLK